jgi:hypothetical protein
MASFQTIPKDVRIKIYDLLDEPLHQVTDWKVLDLVAAFSQHSRLHHEITSYYHSTPVTISLLNEEVLNLVPMYRLLEIRNLSMTVLESERRKTRLAGNKIKLRNAFGTFTIIVEPATPRSCGTSCAIMNRRNGTTCPPTCAEDRAGRSDLYCIHGILVQLFNANTTGIRKFVLQAGKNTILQEDSLFQPLIKMTPVELSIRGY